MATEWLRALYRRLDTRRFAARVVVLLVLSYVGMAAGAVCGWPIVFFASVAINYLACAGLRRTRVLELLTRWQAPVTFRFLVRELALVALFVRAGTTGGTVQRSGFRLHLVLLLLGLAVIHLVAAKIGRWHDRLADGRREITRSVNLVADAPTMDGASDGEAARRSALHWDIVAFVAVATVLPGAPLAGSAWLLAAAVAVVAAACGIRLAWWVREIRRDQTIGSIAHRNATTLAALEALEPEVVVYFSSETTSTYALNVWLETVNRLERSTVIFLREAGHLAHLGPTALPIVVVPDAAAVARYHQPSMRLALYPTSVVNNDDMHRVVGVRHVLIGHGDSDKAVTFSPLHRAFDETWVAGPAARDRYLRNDVGVDPDQIRLVGRPPLAHIRRRATAPMPPYTVLYAPTWEGNFDESDYSSVATMGVAIAQAVIASTVPMRLLVKLHPATGRRSPHARRARSELERVITAAGAPHALVPGPPSALYDAFNSCDVLIADISSVIPDFLAADKPYLVTNPRRFSAEAIRRDLASAAGGFEVEPELNDFERYLVASLVDDPYAVRRAELADYFLGPVVADPIQRFVDLVSTAVDEQATRRDPARR